MKIGLLAYHSACNFGATLQLLSTFCYLRNNGYDPIIINWIPKDLEEFYVRRTPEVQYNMQKELRSNLWKETELCRTSKDVAEQIEVNGIQAIIVGSDAVAQHHAFPENVVFPTKKIISVRKYTQDRTYPNPFWGEFENYLKKHVPIAFLSASSQDSIFKYYKKSLRHNMEKSLSRYSWVSVRDSWTQKMFSYITEGKINPPVTPDPVFAFNNNGGTIIPTKKTILDKFGLPKNYIVLSFENNRGITQEWIDKLVAEAKKLDIACVGMPFSVGPTFGKFPIMIKFPLNPLEWYAIIKYSSGYVGNNMHPIVVSLHNANPFFSFDNYGQSQLKGLLSDDTSSKIKHILSIAGFSDYRVSCIHRYYKLPTPDFVLSKIKSFDREKARDFANRYYQSYLSNMQSIIDSFVNYEK